MSGFIFLPVEQPICIKWNNSTAWNFLLLLSSSLSSSLLLLPLLSFEVMLLGWCFLDGCARSSFASFSICKYNVCMAVQVYPKASPGKTSGTSTGGGGVFISIPAETVAETSKVLVGARSLQVDVSLSEVMPSSLQKNSGSGSSNHNTNTGSCCCSSSTTTTDNNSLQASLVPEPAECSPRQHISAFIAGAPSNRLLEVRR